jgi:hypothetical protein
MIGLSKYFGRSPSGMIITAKKDTREVWLVVLVADDSNPVIRLCHRASVVERFEPAIRENGFEIPEHAEVLRMILPETVLQDEALEFEAHLTQCEQCRQVYNDLRETVDAVHGATLLYDLNPA